MIEAVVFDLGNTLVRFDDRAPHATWERRLGLATGTLWEAVGASVDWRPVFVGGDEDTAWEAAAQVLGLAPTDLPAFRSAFFACERLEDDLLAYAQALRPRYRTAILSDAPAGTRGRTIVKFGLDTCFDAVVLSGEIKVGKPDPQAFQAVIDVLRTSAERTVFVDDSPRNVEGAREFGMRAVLCTDSAQTIRTLQAILT